MIVLITEPLMVHAPLALFVYASDVGVGGAEPQAMVVLEVVAKTAIGAGSTVIVRIAVIVRLQASVNVQLSV